MYHFIGIKGSGMSALAQLMQELGYNVQGSDVEDYFFTEDNLHKKNIPIYVFSKNNIKKDMIIVKGNIYNDENEEVKEAKKLNLEIYTYPQMLGKITEQFKTITVAGCHGKTTTTSLITHVFNETIGTNYLIGDGSGGAKLSNKYLIVEACEYKRHFLEYHPTYAIITNIELDHVDYYKDLDDIIDAYKSYSKLAKEKVIAYGDDDLVRNNINAIFYGINNNNDVIAKNIIYKQVGISFDVKINNRYYGHFDVPFYGKHMLLNTLACITVCYLEGLNKEQIQKSLETYKGAKRRFSEEIIDNNIIIDDYAHHPTEIASLINAVKQKYKGKEIIGVFEPHTFSRTKKFAKEIATILNTLSYNYIMDIHPARELQEDYPDISKNTIMQYLDNKDSITNKEYSKLLKYNDSVILFMSPNDISELENNYKNALKKRH